MSQNIDKLFALLEPYNLSKDDIRVYVYLLGGKQASALKISKDLSITRSRVYTICGNLSSLGLVSITGKKFSQKFIANSYKQFEVLLNHKLTNLEILKGNLPLIFKELQSVETGFHNKAEVIHYRGLDGLKTVTWNTTNTKGDLRILELAHDMSAFLDFDFCERVRMEYVRKGILRKSKQLTNIREIKPWTNIIDFIDLWECRYLDPEELDINIEILVYNDTVTTYQFRDKNIFCVEIKNKDLSKTMQNLFDFIWSRAKRMKRVGERGQVKI